MEVNKNLYELLQNHQALQAGGGFPIMALEGSSRSGKTWAIIEYLIQCCVAMDGLVVSCFRHDGTTHSKSTVRDFHEIMGTDHRDIWQAGRWNGQEKTFAFPNGSVLEFCATNDPMKLHGPERDVAWLNEVMEVGYEAYRQIAMRTRLLTLCDWNPSLNHHWVFDRVLTRDDCRYVHSTYQDNPHLPDQQVAEIEATDPDNPDNVRRGTADRWQWDVYGLGRRSRREGVIYQLWEAIEPEQWPARELCQRWGYGVDFGFADDPSAVIECAIFMGALYVREIVYETGLITAPSESVPNAPSLVGRLKDAGRGPSSHDRYVADGARPDLIQEMRLCDYQVSAAEKGPGSVLVGINLLKSMRWYVHRDSQNVQRELESYVWKQDKSTGVWLGEPVDQHNHAMDAIRYWAQAEIKAQNRMGGQRRTKPKTSTVFDDRRGRRR